MPPIVGTVTAGVHGSCTGPHTPPSSPSIASRRSASHARRTTTASSAVASRFDTRTFPLSRGARGSPVAGLILCPSSLLKFPPLVGAYCLPIPYRLPILEGKGKPTGGRHGHQQRS